MMAGTVRAADLNLTQVMPELAGHVAVAKLMPAAGFGHVPLDLAVEKSGPLAGWLTSNADADAAWGHPADGKAVALPRLEATPSPAPPRPALREAATSTHRFAPAGSWMAGLEAWRLGRVDRAKTLFESVANSSDQPTATIAAAAYWTGRAEQRLERPDLADRWYTAAAKYADTFYGLLARHRLGLDAYAAFDRALFDELDRRLAAVRGGSRSAATGLAPGVELAGFDRPAPDAGIDLALYPLPRWRPRGGFSIDRALLFALMREESGFEPGVESDAGARGLMQLMPETARSMAKRTGVTMHRENALADPELNLTLAQEYVALLLADEHIAGNLMVLPWAYNSGPAAALHWIAAHPAAQHDPLLFLESIPVTESRVFTQRVLANYWIYRHRLNQATPDLDALAAGQWPTYTAIETTGRRHAAN